MTKSNKEFIGVFSVVFGVIILLNGAIWFVYLGIFSRFAETRLHYKYSWLPLTILAAPLGYYLIKRGKQFFITSGETLLQTDLRPPVLYLRSFNIDSEMAKVSARNINSVKNRIFGSLFLPTPTMIRAGLTISSDEELLARELLKIGPPIAVGIPKEVLPELGMARLYFNDGEWQKNVYELMAKAKLVVMLAGFTEGFCIELRMTVQSLDPTKLIILLPFETENQLTISPIPTTDEYSKFCNRAEKLLPKKLPTFSGKPIDGSVLSGFIRFDSEWNAEIIAFENLSNTVSGAFFKVFKSYHQ